MAQAVTPPAANPYLSNSVPQSTDTSGTDALTQVINAMDADRFHQKFGPPPSLRGPDGQPMTPPPVSPAPDPSANQGGVMDTVENVAKATPGAVMGIAAGAVRAVPQAVGGLLDFGNDVGRFIGSSMVPVLKRYPEVARPIVNAANAWNNSSIGQAYNNTFGGLDGHTKFADQLSLRDSLGQVGNPSFNQGSAEALSLAVGYGAAARVAKGVGLVDALADGTAALPKATQFAAKLTAHAAGLGATAGVILDPEQERLSNMLQNAGVHTEFTDWMAAHGTPQEGAMEDRFKTALENAAIGVPIDLAFNTAKYWIKALSDTRAANVLKDRIQSTLANTGKQVTGDPTFQAQAPETQIVQSGAAPETAADGTAQGEPVSSEGPEDYTPEDYASQHLDDAFAGVRSQDALNGLRQDILNAGHLPEDAGQGLPAAGDITSEQGQVPTNVDQKLPISRAIRGDALEDQRTSGEELPSETSPVGDTPVQDVTPESGAGPSPGVTKGRFGAAISKPNPKVPESAIAASARKSRLGIAKDANAALQRSGAPEKLTPETMHIVSDGRIVVSADAKAAADAAGLGRPFISAADTPPPEDMVIHAGAKPYRISAGGIAAEHQAEVSSLEAEGTQASKVIHDQPTADGEALNREFPKIPSGKPGEATSDIPTGEASTAAPEGALDKGLNSLGAMLRDSGGALRVRAFGATPRADIDSFAKDANAWKQSVKATGDRTSDVTWDQTPRVASKVGAWRMGNLASADDMPGLLRSFAERVGQTARPKSDFDLMHQAAAAANEIGEDPTAILEASRQIAGKIGSVDNAMATLRTMWTRSAQDLDEAGFGAKDFTDSNAVSDAEVSQVLQKIYNMDSMSKFVQDAKAGLGRGLRVNQLPDADTYIQSFKESNPDGTIPPRTARAFGPLPRTRQELGDWADLWNMTRGNPLARAKFLEGQLTTPGPWKYLRTSLSNLFTAAILSAPRTFAIEMASPAIMSVVRTIEKTSGAAVLSLNPLASTAERQAMRQVAMRMPAAYLKTFGDIADVWGQVKNAMATNQSILKPRAMGGDLNYSLGPLTPNLLRAGGQTPSPLYSLGNLINAFPRAFSRLHGGVREMTERLSYLGEVRAQAMMEAGQKGLSGNDFANYVSGKLMSSTDAVGAATDDTMLQNAQRSSFTGPVGADGSRMRAISNGIAQLRSDWPEFRYLLPVFNIEANVLGETLRRLPIFQLPGFRNAFSEQAAELAGERGPILKAESHGRFMLGSSFLLGAIGLNRAGLLTGAGPQSGPDRKVWLATHQPYSMRVGGNWVRYDKIPIVGGLMSIPATIADATTHHAGDQNMEDMVLSGAGALAQWFKDRSALRTAAGILNVGSDPTDSVGNFAKQTVGGITSGFVPAALQTTVTQTTDPYLRLKNSWTDYMKSAIPGLSNTLEPVRTVLGEPVQRPYSGIPATVNPFAIAPTTSYKQDPVSDELDRLYQTTGYAAGADPKSLSYGNFDPRQVQLENGRSMQDNAVGMRQEMQLHGMNLRETLQKLFDSPQYDRAVDADSGQPRTSLGDPSRGYMVKKVFDTFETAIKARLGQQSPIALSYLTAAAAKQKDDAYLRNYSADDLVKNPALYQAAGINARAYANKITHGAGLFQALQTGTGQ